MNWGCYFIYSGQSLVGSSGAEKAVSRAALWGNSFPCGGNSMSTGPRQEYAQQSEGRKVVSVSGGLQSWERVAGDARVCHEALVGLLRTWLVL